MSQTANDNDENASRDGANNDDVTGDRGGVPGDDNDVESTKAEDAQSNSGVNEENNEEKKHEDGEGEFRTNKLPVFEPIRILLLTFEC